MTTFKDRWQQRKQAGPRETYDTTAEPVNQPTKSATGSPLRWLPFAFKILMTMAIGFMMLLNAQPWLTVAEQIANGVTVIPFMDSLVKIPFLGGWIEWIAVNLSRIVGLLLWAIVQLIEVMPMIVKDPHIVGMWVEHWDGQEFRLRGDGGSIDQLKKTFNRFPTDWFASISQYRAAAYAIEFLVCFLRFPPYQGGVEAVMTDFPTWDAALIDWWNLVLFLLTMFGFEICLRLILRLWQGVRYFR